jgi:RimJ/RimL family protein N-acetyltransferase
VGGAPVPVPTEWPHVTLRRLDGSHSNRLYDLLQANRAHLTQYGDYRDQVAADPDGLRAELEAADRLCYGIFVMDDLVGRIDLVAVDPPQYGLGYWLAHQATGRGYATIAVKGLLEYARTSLRASDIYAGVTHGNGASAAVLRRAGFTPIARFDTYTRFHRGMGQSSIQD